MKKTDRQNIDLVSVLTCPECGHQARETMPTDACQYFYDCKGCGVVLRPLAGDCCVFCSYGTVPCPPVQIDGKNAGCCG
ncbi:MAG: GDCCVxC domain-containing (seleno)protein [Thalassospira sp.]|uniref:GDCCVxC domain-containing (seleno)protein n=1 Tax=Thalassospira sp. TaxID=1912094 RepID=UPI0032EF6777